MIAPIVKLLRPVFLPLLKLRLDPPHLPEGTTLVRELKPEPQWLTLQYLKAAARASGPFFGALAFSTAIIATMKLNGMWLTLPIFLFTVASVGFSLVAARLDYELRHYLVGDKSLRVSQGAIVHREVTLSYANVQNLEVTSGPLETLFGVKTLTISTAGGGVGGAQLHHARLEGLKDADGVKMLILGMLKGQKDAGLGEPVEAAHSEGLNAGALEEVREAAVNLRNVAESLAVSVDFRQPSKN